MTLGGEGGISQSMNHRIFSPTGVLMGTTKDYIVVLQPPKDSKPAFPIYIKDANP